MNKTELINKLKQLNGLTSDEKAALINLVNTKKKYGLVWEDKPEDVEEQLRENLPVFVEVPEKRITGKPLPKIQETTNLFSTDEATANGVDENTNNCPNHILIEGDNLHALTALTFTHEGKIDVIYIDPPYNTGNKDFKYNDTFVDKEDSYRHSKWLSFMNKRLQLAKKLLSEKGVIFISIDDIEQAQLKLLCDEVFNQENFISNIIWQKKYAASNDTKYISLVHDNILLYAKQKTEWKPNLFQRPNELNAKYKNPDNDPRGDWYSTNLSVKTYSSKNDYIITSPAGLQFSPPPSRCWVVSKEKYEELLNDNRITFGKDGKSRPYLKTYLSEVQAGIVPMSLWLHTEAGHNINAKAEVREIFSDLAELFATPKPTKLIKRIFQLSTNNKKNFILLDFFAGSGTTLHATMQLNADDGGNRQCILVTNNENNICEEVTYERNKRVIQGYSNAKGIAIAGLTNNNLRYYKSSFVPSMKTEQNKRLLTSASTALLCIKEDCYLDITAANGFAAKECQLFTNETGKYLAVVYHSRKMLQVCEQLKQVIDTLSLSEKVKLYAFSPEKETLVEDFIEVAEKIDAVPLPEAIYNAYRTTFRILKLNKLKTKNTNTVSEETNDELPNQTEDQE